MEFTKHYPLPPFRELNTSRLIRVIGRYPLATLVTPADGLPVVSQAPLVVDGSGTKLLGHLDRNNPHCARIAEGGPILCLFHGPNHYMTPSIYPDTQYPGWNYVTVHVTGQVRAVEDTDWLEAMLMQLADENEPPGSGYRLRPTQEKFDMLIRRILGLEIEIEDMKGVLKLAQDKGPGHAEIARQHLADVARDDIGEFLTELLS